MAEILSNSVFSIFTVQKIPQNKEQVTLNKPETFTHKRKFIKEDDVLMKYPIRGLGYANEIGEAIRPLSNSLASFMWCPALLYFGADIWDKYRRGEDDTYQKPSVKKGVEQAIFQGLASVTLPTLSVILGQTAANAVIDKFPDFNQKIVKKIQSKPVVDSFFKKFSSKQHSGYKNAFLASVGLVTLLIMAKPMDLLTAKFIEKVVKPKFYDHK